MCPERLAAAGLLWDLADPLRCRSSEGVWRRALFEKVADRDVKERGGAGAFL